ncbi:MAG: hypothetical protein V2J51_01880 [Erythrobacter sp.]|jgi:hypothetical protein|nr:hypothetical protein [Erythrobacter sp.]
MQDIEFADLVVIGRIENYRIVREQEWRDRMLAQPNLDPDLREIYSSDKTLLPDYAMFDIVIDRSLVGTTAQRITVTWDNSTFEEPVSLSDVQYVVALRAPRSEIPPLRGPSATVFVTKRSDQPAVLQAPCSSPFILAVGSREAREAMELLER